MTERTASDELADPAAAAAAAASGQVGGGVIVVHSDIVCPWAHIATHRLQSVRRRLGVDDEIRVDHRAFPLELLDGRPTSRAEFDHAVVIGAEIEPDAGWAPWRAPDSEFAVTSLPALEAVQAAADQGPAVAERLDLALRRAFWQESRCISILPVVLEVAGGVDGLDVDALAAELWSGRPRRELRRHLDEARSDAIEASPTLCVHGPAGPQRWTNPGITLGDDAGQHMVTADDPSVYDEIVEQALATQSFEAG